MKSEVRTTGPFTTSKIENLNFFFLPLLLKKTIVIPHVVPFGTPPHYLGLLKGSRPKRAQICDKNCLATAIDNLVFWLVHLMSLTFGWCCQQRNCLCGDIADCQPSLSSRRDFPVGLQTSRPPMPHSESSRPRGTPSASTLGRRVAA